ncbi:MAG: hypothetical protein M1453_13105 [Acidobacteria bacterium]|nr:hypothetical protein [Acidobacteriota bacterium]MCL5288915.1 hypothetical protein [Acidobacteriota bacterium]
MSHFSKGSLLGLLILATGFGAWFYFRVWRTASKDKPEISLSRLKKGPEPEPGGPVPIMFVEPDMNCSERRAFLLGDYKILRSVSDLPGGIQKLYAAKGESWTGMADPGKRFEATDVITDPTLPLRRLVFAGVAQDRAFVHYEQGGIGRYFVVEFFRLKSSETAIGLWRGFYGPVKSIEELRRLMSESGCK